MLCGILSMAASIDLYTFVSKWDLLTHSVYRFIEASKVIKSPHEEMCMIEACIVRGRERDEKGA